MRALAIVLVLAGTAAAQQAPVGPPPPSAEELLRHDLDELQARQRELEKRLQASEVREEARPKIEIPTSHFRLGRDGFAFGTADGKSEVRLRATLHFDGRAFVGGTPVPDTFLIRRARPFIEGTLFGLIDFRLMPDFAQGQSVLQDAYIDIHPWQWLRLRGGKFRSPIGLEWLQSDCTIALLERSLVSDLVPFRDLGLMLSGDVGEGTLSYALAMFNGAPDGANGPDFDPQSEKDYVGRVFLRPLRLSKAASFANLGFGVAASYGSVKGTAGTPNLPTFRSPGQQPIFTYINNATIPDPATLPAGDRWRVSPQAYAYIGPVGVLAEYVFSSQRVQHLGASASLDNQAWNVTASFVMTLEHAAYEGVVPKRPVDFRHKNFGAFELVVRYSELRIDPGAFPTYADPALSVQRARELAGGLNWYMTEYLRVMISYHRTDFTGGASTGDREPENALMGRLQIAL